VRGTWLHQWCFGARVSDNVYFLFGMGGAAKDILDLDLVQWTTTIIE